MNSTIGTRAIGQGFETHLTHVGGDIVGHWFQRSPWVSWHGLTASQDPNSSDYGLTKIVSPTIGIRATG